MRNLFLGTYLIMVGPAQHVRFANEGVPGIPIRIVKWEAGVSRVPDPDNRTWPRRGRAIELLLHNAPNHQLLPTLECRVHCTE
jgi:hypothetical protein